MGFNINFGQAVISNAQKDRQLDLEQQRINNQREAQAASAANQAAASFFSRVNAQEANALREKELNLREQKQEHDLSWDDALKQQEIAEREARTDNLRKISAKYDAAYESDKAQAEEMANQARRRQELLNGELGSLFLSAYTHGGRVSPSQIKAFNEATGAQYDFIGNTMSIPMSDGSVRHETVGDGKGFFLGQFQRDEKGNIVFGDDGTPMTQMVEMPKEMRNALLSSAYGKAYVNGGGMSASGQGVEIARINADQREKDRLLREKIANERLAFNREKMKFYVANAMNKEAAELFSRMPDEEKEYFKAKYKEEAKAWLGEEKKPQPTQTQEPAKKKVRRIIKTAKDKNGNVWNLVEFEDGTQGEVRAE